MFLNSRGLKVKQVFPEIELKVLLFLALKRLTDIRTNVNHR